MVSEIRGYKPEVSVVIPCLNEAPNAASYGETLFEPLEKAGFKSEILFSDGGSSDGTVKILERLAASRPGVRLIKGEGASSFGESMLRGVRACEGEYIVFLEADLSFSPGDISKLLAAAKNGCCDCVCGSPFLGGFEGISFKRKALTYFANLLLRLRFGLSITSYTQIFKLFRADKLKRLNFESEGFSLDAELLAKSLALGFKVAEVPVTMTARKMGRSKLNAAREIFNCLKLVIKGV